MPATGIAGLMFLAAVVLGAAAVVRRSRRLGVLAGAVCVVLVVYVGLLLLVIDRM